MTHKLKLNNIENVGKIIILISMILTLSFFIFVLFFELSGKNVSIGGNYLFLIMLVNIGILMLIYVSVHKFIRAYRKTAKEDK